MEVLITAEIEKKKPEKQKISQLDEERAAKLEKLKLLKLYKCKMKQKLSNFCR